MNAFICWKKYWDWMSNKSPPIFKQSVRAVFHETFESAVLNWAQMVSWIFHGEGHSRHSPNFFELKVLKKLNT